MNHGRSLTASVALLLVFFVAPLTPGGQERPLPDEASFLAEVRKHLQTDYSLQSSYTYVETRREQKLDKRGRVVDESIKVFENYPGLPGEGRWERLTARDGVPLSAEELESQDRKRQKKAEAYARRAASEPAKLHAEQVRDWEAHRRKTAEAVEDIFRVYEIRLLGRERLDGHDTVAFSLAPRRGAQPRTREGGIMRHFTARASVSESDHELVRLEAEAVAPVPFGWGVLARMHQGARLTFERRKVNGEVWLPAVSSYAGSARVGLVRTLRRAGTSEYSNYRKFSVETSVTYVREP